MSRPIPIILDTDIAGDPDDVFCLNFLLKSPEANVALIITADEHDGHRARFVRHFLERFGRADIPVVQGVDLGNSRYCLACDEAPLKETVPTDTAAAVAEVLGKHPDAQYLCVAPQSNLAGVIRHAPGLLHDYNVPITLMGGGLKDYRDPRKAEHNIRYDVDAARAVLGSGLRLRYVLGDTTFNPAIKIDARHEIFKILATSPKPLHKIIVEQCRRFFESSYNSTMMHDPLTAAAVITPELVTFREACVIMDEHGCMHEAPEGSKVEVSATADYTRFLMLFAERL